MNNYFKTLIKTATVVAFGVMAFGPVSKAEGILGITQAAHQESIRRYEAALTACEKALARGTQVYCNNKHDPVKLKEAMKNFETLHLRALVVTHALGTLRTSEVSDTAAEQGKGYVISPGLRGQGVACANELDGRDGLLEKGPVQGCSK